MELWSPVSRFYFTQTHPWILLPLHFKTGRSSLYDFSRPFSIAITQFHLVRRGNLCYKHIMKAKQTLGWLFVLTGLLFLLSGLIVMMFATLGPGGMLGPSNLPNPSSIWVSLANALMDFTIKLLMVEWTPVRVGVFMIVVGILFEGSGGYLITSGGKR
jgi:predicted transporter